MKKIILGLLCLVSVGSTQASLLGEGLRGSVLFALTLVAERQYGVSYLIQDKVNFWLAQLKQKSDALQAAQKKN